MKRVWRKGAAEQEAWGRVDGSPPVGSREKARVGPGDFDVGLRQSCSILRNCTVADVFRNLISEIRQRRSREIGVAVYASLREGRTVAVARQSLLQNMHNKIYTVLCCVVSERVSFTLDDYNHVACNMEVTSRCTHDWQTYNMYTHSTSRRPVGCYR